MTKRPKLKELLKATLLSKADQRGVLLLIPLLVVITILFNSFKTTNIEPSLTDYSDLAYHNKLNSDGAYSYPSHSTTTNSYPLRKATELFEFDPNTINQEDLERLGFSPRQAEAIVRYRNSGARFAKADDFARCYTVSPEKFKELKPHIHIGDEFNASTYGNKEIPIPTKELFKFDPNTINQEDLERLGFSPRQAEAIVRYRNSGARFAKADDFARCYTVSPEKFKELKPHIHIGDEFKLDSIKQKKYSTTNTYTKIEKVKTTPIIELNSADSATLTTIRGIGPLTAGRIVIYRELLGGFASTSQLSEIVGMTENNYLMILQQISVDSSRIKKIDINFAAPQQINEHPYLGARTVNKLFKNRQLKGGWSSIDELVKDKILTIEQAAKLSPYIYFSER